MSKRPRIEISNLDDDDQPIASILQRNVKRAIVLDTVNTGGYGYHPTSPRPSVVLTMSSIETKEKMTSFVEYFDRIAANNEYYLKTHKDQTSVLR
jgi:hypothetical protein